jgi:flagellin-like hook-associated protein FlgL
MPLYINTTRSFHQIARGVDEAQSKLRVSLRRLSSGLRINQSRDDAAGLAISERLSSRLRGALSSIQNMNAGASLLQVVDGALNESQHAILRMRELSVMAANETLTDIDRRALNVEFKLLNAQLDMIAEQTNYNGIHLLDGAHQSLELHIGSQADDAFRLKLAHVTANELGRQARYTTQRRGVFVSDTSTGDLKINGVAVRETVDSDDLLSYSHSYGSSIAKAAAVNAVTEFTGVRALIGHNVIRGFEPIRKVDLDPQHFFKVNGYSVTAIQVEARDATGVLVEHINAGYDETGVVAHVDQDGHLVLTAEDGRNITVEYGQAVVRDAIRMVDYHGDAINLVDTVDPVQTDLDGDIDSVTFVGAGTYSGDHQIVGDVTINGVTSVDLTGGYERPRDKVDYVLEVIKPGPIGVATFRFKEESIADQTIDNDIEDYLFNQEGVVTSANGSKINIEGATHYNEASDRTYTLTVTKNGLPSAANAADIPEFTVSVQNTDEVSDTSASGPHAADQGTSVDIGHGVIIDFPVDPKRALRPNGTSMNVGNDLVRTSIGANDTYNDHPQFRTWTGDRTTYFTYEVVSAGHAAGNREIAGSNTGAAEVKITAQTPSLGTTESTTVTLNPNANQNINYKGMTTRFVRRLGSTSNNTSLTGDYQGNFRSNDSSYVGSERRVYEIKVLEAGPLTTTSALDAQITVKDNTGAILQTYTINDLRAQHEFELGQGVHFEGAVADFTASSSVVGDPNPVGGAANIVSRINHNYNGATNEAAVLEVTQAGRPGTAQYRYYYQSAPGVDLATGALNVGNINLPDALSLQISDTPDPEFSSFNAGPLAMIRDASGYTEQQDAKFTAVVQDLGGGQELSVDWVFADGSTHNQIVALNPGYEGNDLDIGFGVTVNFILAANNGESFQGSIEAHELSVGERWNVDLSAARVEVNDIFTVTARPRILDVGTTWEITGEVPMWEVGDTYTINAQHNFNDAISTLSNSINLSDPNTGQPIMGTVNLTGNGSFQTGDEIRIRTRGFTGSAVSSGLYTDNLYPTNYIVTITKPGWINQAEYDWVREDGRVDTQFGGSGSGLVTAANVPFLLEEGVFVSFLDNGSGDSYLAVGDQFVIPVGQKLEYTFAGEITLQSDDNIELEHVNSEAVNTFGRLLYEGEFPNEAGTAGNLLSGPLGQNAAVSVDDLDILTTLKAEESIDTLDEAIDQITMARSDVGAVLNQIERRIESESASVHQLAQTRQRIRDADIAVEVSELARAQTRQSAAPLLAQVARLEIERSLFLLMSLDSSS